MSDMDQVWEAFDQWERTQVCIRGHVRVVREEIEKELEALRATRRRDSELIRSLAEERNDLSRFEDDVLEVMDHMADSDEYAALNRALKRLRDAEKP